jgi:hypothetical protein
MRACVCVELRRWFDLDHWTDNPLCFQYTTAIRFLSYLVIFIAVRYAGAPPIKRARHMTDLLRGLQAKQTLVSYFLAKVPPAEGMSHPHLLKAQPLIVESLAQ